VLIYQNIVSLFVMADAIRNNFLLQIAFFCFTCGRYPGGLCFLVDFFRSLVFF